MFSLWKVLRLNCTDCRKTGEKYVEIRACIFRLDNKISVWMCQYQPSYWIISWSNALSFFPLLFISLFFLSEGEMELFRMSVKIPGRNRAIFLLTYEELLQRRLGYYQHVTSVRPMQLVSKLSVAITIVEHSRIKYLEVLPLRKSKTSGSRNSSRTSGISF